MSQTAQLSFGPFVLQPARRALLLDGTPVPIGGRAFDILVTLVEERDRIVGKEELLARVWPGNAVEDNNLTVNISALRKALRGPLQDPPDDEQPPEQRPDQRPDAHDQRYIRTVSGRGYRFVAPVQTEAPSPAPTTAPTTGPPLDPCEMPSIAVLPFEHMGADPAHDHFGDGIAEDIIAELSRNRWLTVISRASSFTYRRGPAESGEVARQLGVRYVLEGSIRTAGDRVRVTVTLVDATTNRHLIGERYDRRLADLFAVQDEITQLIITCVRPALYEAEQARSIRRHPDSLDAWAAYQRGVWLFSRPEGPERRSARLWFERAIALDERFAPGFYGLALVYLHDGSSHLPNTVPDWQPRGESLALQSVLLDGRDSGAHSILGLARMVRGDHAGALEATGQALELNPNDATAHGTQGATLVFSDRPAEGLQALATSLRLSPRDPRLHVRHAHIGLGYYFGDQLTAAEAQARMIIRNWPTFSFGPRLLAMVLSDTGRIAEASRAIEAAIALSPSPFDNFSNARMPWYRPDDHARVVRALRRAGWTGRAD